MLTISIKYLHDLAQKPQQATPGSAGWDVYAVSNGVVQPGTVQAIPLGFALELPYGWQAKIKQRGSMFNKKLLTNDSPIDADYTGEVFALVNNLGQWPWFYKQGERIGQLLFEPVPVVQFRKVDELTPTLRGDGCLGSTGV